MIVGARQGGLSISETVVGFSHITVPDLIENGVNNKNTQ